MNVIPEPNYLMYGFILIVITWPVVFIFLIAYDVIKKNKFRPFYRAAWPFVALSEIG